MKGCLSSILLWAAVSCCSKRPVSALAVERLADRVERFLQESGEREIASQVLGERVMAELVALDPLAAVRFASVFQDFQSAEDYTEFFEQLGARDDTRDG